MSNERQLEAQTVVVIGGSSGIGLETARRARREGASVIITARDPDSLHRAGLELGASIAAFDANDLERLARFFAELPGPVDHLLLSGAGGPHYTPFAELEPDTARRDVDTHLLFPLQVARNAVRKIRRGGTLLLIGGTCGRAVTAGPVITAVTTALPAMTRSLALELAPIRVNLITPGFIDTPLSAAVPGDELDARRDRLRAALPIERVVGGRRRGPRGPPHDEHLDRRRNIRRRRRAAAAGLKRAQDHRLDDPSIGFGPETDGEAIQMRGLWLPVSVAHRCVDLRAQGAVAC